MPPLEISPLPTLRNPRPDSRTLLIEREGFVDEEAVAALRAAQRTVPRSSPRDEDLALAADDLDFAGWRLSKAVPVRRPEVPPQVIAAIVRRAASQAAMEKVAGAPRRRNHRRWLFATAGLLMAILIVGLVFFLSAKSGWDFTKAEPPGELTKPRQLAGTLVEVTGLSRRSDAVPRQ